MSGFDGRPDPGLCSVRWCDETQAHDGPHRRSLFDGHGLDVATGRPTIVQLWLQGESARVRACVLVCDARETGLTWRQADRLAAALGRAQRP